jgi:hypothetical protein
MKKGGCALFGCAVVVGLLALAGLAVLGWISPEPSAPAPPPESPPRRATRPPVPLDPNSYHLTFHFRDAEEEPREVSCAIRKSDYEREQAGFGFVEMQRVNELNRELRELLAREAEQRGVERYFEIEVYGEGSIRWNWSYPGGTDPKTVERINAFHAWLEKDSPTLVNTIEERYFRAHGMRLKGDTYSIDYETLTRNATEPLADCYSALRSLGGRRSDALLGLFLTFMQDLRYELPKDVDEQGRETLGFRVPTAVLVQGAGDCDSKSAAFCALWRQIPARVLLVLVPEHALVAVEGKPGPDQKSVRLGNRTFILCEVAGPGRFRPGETDVSGSFEYILIEPA